jgi:hypothetical protein
MLSKLSFINAKFIHWPQFARLLKIYSTAYAALGVLKLLASPGKWCVSCMVSWPSSSELKRVHIGHVSYVNQNLYPQITGSAKDKNLHRLILTTS